MSKSLTFASNQLFDTFRTETQGGKDWLVVKGVPLVEGVLNGRFVSADEFGTFTNDWNDVPVVLRHPKKNGGSARVPATDVPVVGRFYNAKMDGKRLVGEYWLDKGMLENSEDGLQLLDLIAGRRPIETSTGYWSESVPKSGKHNDRSYGLVDRNIHPDHIALLFDEVGACSLADGCGLNRNSAGLAANHYGPGPHKDGSSQDVHGGGKGGAKKTSTSTTGSGVGKNGKPNWVKSKFGNRIVGSGNSMVHDIGARDPGEKLAYGFKQGDWVNAEMNDGSTQSGELVHYADDHFYVGISGAGWTEVYKTKVSKTKQNQRDDLADLAVVLFFAQEIDSK